MNWWAAAACRDESTQLFFPDNRTPVVEVERAYSVCEGCPVHDECLIFALRQGDKVHGIWGGTSERERKRLRKTAWWRQLRRLAQ